MKSIFLYPGQGAQYPGMGIDLYHQSQQVRTLFELASDVSRIDVLPLLSEGKIEDISQTDRSQILITLVNLSARTVLKERGIESDACAGFSLGEYAALVDAGVLSPEAVFPIVCKRGLLMEEISRTYDTESQSAGMIAVIGLSHEKIAELLKEAGIAHAYCAIVNSPIQTVVAGTATAITAASNMLSKEGARRIIALKVSGPFHSPLMEEAGKAFRSFLDDIPFSPPQKPIYSNVSGEQVHTGEKLKTLCVQQLTSTVLWTKEEASILSDGYSSMYEVGPGTVLCGLWRAFAKCIPEDIMEVRAAGNLESIEAITHDS